MKNKMIIDSAAYGPQIVGEASAEDLMELN
jgi:hypothetical protein